ncbi:hypothetical protein LAC81_09820 [Ensifer adhaerens]|uniref:hypothetical protein n=1 Tax=Ensifer adhaerens TaxID=106592 RepID=UPI001CC0BF39|nr:hypothetical protein [Ensifer adhaerens]MBZ7922082.1 hypothetical protein [Ensifer adhaerens]UAX94470.1 hypothetical protein LAC78_09815 [Ensifer adhaerens]UAY02105.1 hypothetical protein LAC80_09825 [Ensifer adhaerens]UAY09488.1 hypothetical protein LAC81_09820 [Ensifer adhaerens]
MKIIIAVAASLALAGSAFAAISPAPAEKHPAAKTVGTVELAGGVNKPGSLGKNGKINENRQRGKVSKYDD